MPAHRKYATEAERIEARNRLARERASTPEAKARKAAHDATPEARALACARYARYRATEKYVIAQRRYRQSHKGRAAIVEAAERERKRRPERIHARSAVAIALRYQALIRPDACQECGSTKRSDAHHHLGYEPEHWLDVEWLCRKCHQARHRGRPPTAGR